jgi:hypothetical protein
MCPRREQARGGDGSGELEHDRRRAGWSVGQTAWRLGITVRECREIEAGTRSPSFETWDGICKLFGWPQTFARQRASSNAACPTTHAPPIARSPRRNREVDHGAGYRHAAWKNAKRNYVRLAAWLVVFASLFALGYSVRVMDATSEETAASGLSGVLVSLITLTVGSLLVRSRP